MIRSADLNLLLTPTMRSPISF